MVVKYEVWYFASNIQQYSLPDEIKLQLIHNNIHKESIEKYHLSSSCKIWPISWQSWPLFCHWICGCISCFNTHFWAIGFALVFIGLSPMYCDWHRRTRAVVDTAFVDIMSTEAIFQHVANDFSISIKAKLILSHQKLLKIKPNTTNYCSTTVKWTDGNVICWPRGHFY